MAFSQRLEGRNQLPVNNFAGQVLEQIERNRCVLIRGGTGCGKSTQVPQFILDSYIKEGRGADCNIVITQVCGASNTGGLLVSATWRFLVI